MDRECGTGRYVESRYQLVMEAKLIDAIRERAKVDGVKAADVVRSAVASYLGWPVDYKHPRPGRWSAETRGSGQRGGQ